MDSRLGSTRLHSRRHARSLQPTMGATTARQLKGSGSIPPRQRRLDGWASSAHVAIAGIVRPCYCPR